MPIVKYFDLYLNEGVSVAPVIHANQYDETEQWIFTLYEESGTKYTPATGAIIGIKADDKGILNTATVNSSGQVVVNETKQMTAAAGTAVFELLIDNSEHGTANFKVEVKPRPADNADMSDSDYSLLQDAVDSAEKILDIIGDTDLEEVVHDDIDEWLDAHPEATTTVQDDSLTTPKYKDGSVTKAKLASDAFDGLIAETASGNPATFSDGADGIPVKALKVGIEPIQNLNGYDHPWAGRSGANVLDPNIKMTAETIDGATLTTTNGYQFHMSGTASGSSGSVFRSNAIPFENRVPLPAGTYTLPIGITAQLRKITDGSFISNSGGTFTVNESFYVYQVWYIVAVGATVNYDRIIALAKGNTAPTEWTPYENICPIYPSNGRNLLQVTAISQTINGVTFTVDTDGTVTANGTATARAVCYLASNFTLKAGDYNFNGSQQTLPISCYLNLNGGGVSKSETGSDFDKAFTLNADTTMNYCRIDIASGTVCNNLVFKPMIRLDGTNSTYQPYQGIVVQQTGKNLWSLDSSYSPSGYQIILNRLPFALKAGTYTFSAVPNIESDTIVLFGYHADGTRTEIARLLASTSRRSGTSTISKDVVSLYFVSNRAGTISDIQLELGSTATSYEPYTGNTYPLSLGREVYGGRVNLVTGVLTIDKASITLTASNRSGFTTYSSNGRGYWAISDMKTAPSIDKANVFLKASNCPIDATPITSASSATAMALSGYGNTQGVYIVVPNLATETDFDDYMNANPTQLVYPLAEPQTIQLTPKQVTSLLGINHISADCGNVEVVYRADTKLYIDSLTEPDSDMVADMNIESGKYFIVNNHLYLSTTAIAQGDSIVVGMNCTETNLAEALNALNA